MFPFIPVDYRALLDRFLNPLPVVEDGVEPHLPEMVVQHDHPWKGKAEPRPIMNVTAITVHQTYVIFGVSKKLLREHDGDRRAALLDRFTAAPYHVVALDSGGWIWNNPWGRYTYHGGPLNQDSVGFCVEARHDTLASQWREGKHSEWTEAKAENARHALKRTIGLLRESGAPLREIWCHRQGSKSRGRDPGELIFRDVVAPVAREAALTIPVGFTRGGSTIPREWWRHRNPADTISRPVS